MKSRLPALMIVILLLAGHACAMEETAIPGLPTRLQWEQNTQILTGEGLSEASRANKTVARLSYRDETFIWQAVAKDSLQPGETLFSLTVGELSSNVPGYMECRGESTAAGVEIYGAGLATCRDGYVYLLSVSNVGAPVSGDTLAALEYLAQTMVFVGTEAEEVNKAPVLPESDFAAPPAEVRITQTDVPIALLDAPAQWNSLQLTVHGTTVPDTPLRYYVNGDGKERFRSDENGNFTCAISFPKDGDYTVSIQAIRDNDRGAASFRVSAARAEVPAALETGEAVGWENSVTVRGITLPDATVTLISDAGRKKNIKVSTDGTFVLNIDLPKKGSIAYTVKCQVKGFAVSNLPLSVTRTETPEEQFEKKWQDAGKNGQLALSGIIERYYSLPEETGIVLSCDGTEYLLLTDSVAPYHIGDHVHAVCDMIRTDDTLPVCRAAAIIEE